MYYYDQVYYSTYIDTSQYTSLQCYIVQNALVQKWLEIEIRYARYQTSESVPLPFTMYPIVEIMASPPTINTHSQKHHLPQNHPVHQNFENGMAILNTRYYFFTCPITLDDHTYIHMVQQDTCLYDLQDLEPEELAEWKRIKKNQARRRKMRE